MIAWGQVIVSFLVGWLLMPWLIAAVGAKRGQSANAA